MDERNELAKVLFVSELGGSWTDENLDWAKGQFPGTYDECLKIADIAIAHQQAREPRHNEWLYHYCGEQRKIKPYPSGLCSSCTSGGPENHFNPQKLILELQSKLAELLESRDKFIRVACSAWEDAPDGTALSDILVEKTEEWLSGSLVLSEAERENQIVILRKQVAELEAERGRFLAAGKRQSDTGGLHQGEALPKGEASEN